MIVELSCYIRNYLPIITQQLRIFSISNVFTIHMPLHILLPCMSPSCAVV
nr:MAG TPA: hypothetical protein [Caudoviricetes sp.]